MTCSVTDCDRPRYCKGFCTKHYERWRAHGDLDTHYITRDPFPCKVKGCDKLYSSNSAKNWCKMHYTRWLRHGDTKLHNSRSLMSRFMKFAFPEPMSGCWIWTGSIMWSGYPLMKDKKRKTTRAHRIAYQLFKGPIPQNLTIDHLCRNRACVNPDHLEAVTIQVNTIRGYEARKKCLY